MAGDLPKTKPGNDAEHISPEDLTLKQRVSLEEFEYYFDQTKKLCEQYRDMLKEQGKEDSEEYKEAEELLARIAKIDANRKRTEGKIAPKSIAMLAEIADKWEEEFLDLEKQTGSKLKELQATCCRITDNMNLLRKVEGPGGNTVQQVRELAELSRILAHPKADIDFRYIELRLRALDTLSSIGYASLISIGREFLSNSIEEGMKGLSDREVKKRREAFVKAAKGIKILESSDATATSSYAVYISLPLLRDGDKLVGHRYFRDAFYKYKPDRNEGSKWMFISLSEEEAKTFVKELNKPMQKHAIFHPSRLRILGQE